MDIVKLKAVQPTGRAKIQMGTSLVELDTYTLIFEENDGKEKAAVVGCKPEHNKAVGKALLKRIYPLRKDPDLEPKEEETMGEAICGSHAL